MRKHNFHESAQNGGCPQRQLTWSKLQDILCLLFMRASLMWLRLSKRPT